uniref:Uncharacterized protein n=1 Tax=Cacopsylla melanoneura TaxID=428564 RepID=A0A8D8ZA24_9HEMI
MTYFHNDNLTYNTYLTQQSSHYKPNIVASACVWHCKVWIFSDIRTITPTRFRKCPANNLLFTPQRSRSLIRRVQTVLRFTPQRSRSLIRRVQTVLRFTPQR